MTAVPGAAALPTLARRPDVLAWDVPEGWCALSSAAVGGGLVRPRWVLNATVDGGFARTDLDAWAAEVAGQVGLEGPGCALLTAADVARVEHAHRDGVDVWATVGVTRPTWPHEPRGPVLSEVHGDGPPPPGTVNIVVSVPVPLTPSALVQAVGTLTEAKAQVLVRSGVPGTGTASDAVVVMCPGPDVDPRGDAATRTGAPVPFAGVRSAWGRRIGDAVHDAVLAGLAAHPWAPDPRDPERVW